MIPEPDYYIPPGITAVPVDTFIIVPFVDGMLRPETMQALHDADEAYLTAPIDPGDPYHYAAQFRDWWKLPNDIVIMEQDMVPTVDQFRELIYADAAWATMRYHVGAGQYTTGLGFCKITRQVREAYPDAAVNITTDPRGNGNLVDWISLNEAVTRHLERLGVVQTVLPGTVAHLHYPEPADVH